MAESYSLETDPSGLPETQNGVKYEVCSVGYEAPKDMWAEGQNQTVIVARVLYVDSGNFVQDMVGYARVADSNQPIINRRIPERNPREDSADQWCIACEAIDEGGGEVEYVEGYQGSLFVQHEFTPGPGRDPESAWPVPLWKRYRCVYASLPYLVENDAVPLASASRELTRYVVRTYKETAREVPYAGGQWVLKDDTTKTVQNTVFRICVYGDVTYLWKRVPLDSVPRGVAREAEGTVNSEAFDYEVEGYEFPKGTLLFTGFSEYRYTDANGSRVSDVTYTFKYASQGWNLFLSNKNEFVEVVLKTDTTKKPYETYDFVKLFTPGAEPDDGGEGVLVGG